MEETNLQLHSGNKIPSNKTISLPS